MFDAHCALPPATLIQFAAHVLICFGISPAKRSFGQLHGLELGFTILYGI